MNMNHILTEISTVYAENSKAEGTVLMALYTAIGKKIASDETANLTALAGEIKNKIPHAKGFSPRNLRRMRDF